MRPYLTLDLWRVTELIPCPSQTTAISLPATSCPNINNAIICSSLNLLSRNCRSLLSGTDVGQFCKSFWVSEQREKPLTEHSSRNLKHSQSMLLFGDQPVKRILMMEKCSTSRPMKRNANVFQANARHGSGDIVPRGVHLPAAPAVNQHHHNGSRCLF